MDSVDILFGPYGTQLEQVAKEQGFSVGSPSVLLDNAPVRQAIGNIVSGYLATGARGVTVPCFGARSLLHQSDGTHIYKRVLRESLHIVLEQLERRVASTRHKVKIMFCLGPAFDCYDPEGAPTLLESVDFHDQQIAAVRELSRKEKIPVTLVHETTPSGEEAEGIAKALRRRIRDADRINAIIGYPFTYDGEPLGDESFQDIIRRVDRTAGDLLLGQSFNCGPIEGALKALKSLGSWAEKIFSVYPNASSKPHLELNGSNGHHQLMDPFHAAQHLRFLAATYGLQLIGGCCGYDHADVATLVRTESSSPLLPKTDLSLPSQALAA